MSIIRCKICGGDVIPLPDRPYGICESCGNPAPLPRMNDEQRAAAFNRGNELRRQGRFDLALEAYRRILAEDDTDAEAHWCCALCRYGIEYVEDPETAEWVPTCHLAGVDSFLADVDYQAALAHSDGLAQKQYRREGARIAAVQREVLAATRSAAPFDVFICCRYQTEDGGRTPDSVLAQEIFDRLTAQGLRTFFARVSLEGAEGESYEPRIFAALRSARVMVLVCGSRENILSPWVQNEWSRFLSLMRTDPSRLLLPCCQDMDPEDLPEQLAAIQAYDAKKIGFLQDLVLGVRKAVRGWRDREREGGRETVVVQGTADLEALLRRGSLDLEDGDWESAAAFFDRALDFDAECGEAYLGKALAAAHAGDIEELFHSRRDALEAAVEAEGPEILQLDVEAREAETVREYGIPNYLPDDALREGLEEIDRGYLSRAGRRRAALEREERELLEDRNLDRAFRFAAGDLARVLARAREDHFAALLDWVQEASAEETENRKAAKDKYSSDFESTLDHLVGGAEDRREADYEKAAALEGEAAADPADPAKLAAARDLFLSLGDYRDASERADACGEAVREAKRRRRNAARQRRQRAQLLSAGIGVAAGLLLGLPILLLQGVLPLRRYEAAEAQFSTADTLAIGAATPGDRRAAAELYAAAAEAFAALDNYHDSASRSAQAREAAGFQAAEALLEEGRVPEAAAVLGAIPDSAAAWDGSYILWNSQLPRQVLAAGNGFTAALRADGTAVIAGQLTEMQEISLWRDLTDLAAGTEHLVGLRADGSVLAAGSTVFGQTQVHGWENVVEVAAGERHTVGLLRDGTVVAAGDNQFGQRNVEGWRNVVAVAAGKEHTAGLLRIHLVDVQRGR